MHPAEAREVAVNADRTHETDLRVSHAVLRGTRDPDDRRPAAHLAAVIRERVRDRMQDGQCGDCGQTVDATMPRCRCGAPQ